MNVQSFFFCTCILTLFFLCHFLNFCLGRSRRSNFFIVELQVDGVHVVTVRRTDGMYALKEYTGNEHDELIEARAIKRVSRRYFDQDEAISACIDANSGESVVNWKRDGKYSIT